MPGVDARIMRAGLPAAPHIGKLHGVAARVPDIGPRYTKEGEPWATGRAESPRRAPTCMSWPEMRMAFPFTGVMRTGVGTGWPNLGPAGGRAGGEGVGSGWAQGLREGSATWAGRVDVEAGMHCRHAAAGAAVVEGRKSSCRRNELGSVQAGQNQTGKSPTRSSDPLGSLGGVPLVQQRHAGQADLAALEDHAQHLVDVLGLGWGQECKGGGKF